MSDSWFLYFNHAQYGPYSEQEVKTFLAEKKITSEVFAWKQGMKDWDRISDLKEFKTLELVSTEPSDQRQHPRKPLHAQVISTDHRELSFGLCQDLSLGGMQVLTRSIPGKVGTQIRLNVSPTSEDPTISPFVAMGTIVRVLENQRGFSFRFDDLDENAKKIIKTYVQNS